MRVLALQQQQQQQAENGQIKDKSKSDNKNNKDSERAPHGWRIAASAQHFCFGQHASSKTSVLENPLCGAIACAGKEFLSRPRLGSLREKRSNSLNHGTDRGNAMTAAIMSFIRNDHPEP